MPKPIFLLDSVVSKVLLLVAITPVLSKLMTMCSAGGGGGGFGQSSVPSGLGNVKSINAGKWHTCVIKADDSVQCWGADWDGESTVPSGLSSVKSVAGGDGHTCAIKADDSLQCWGSDTNGESTVPADFQ